MCDSSRITYNDESISDNFDLKLFSNEETFGFLNFSDLDYCSSPCLNESLISPSQKSLLQIPNMDRNLKGDIPNGTDRFSIDGEEYFSISSPLVDLSPGVEFAETLFGTDFGKDCYLESGDFGNLINQAESFEDFSDLVGTRTDSKLDDESKSGLPVGWELNNLGIVGAEETSQPSTIQADSNWLTNTTISPDALTFTGLRGDLKKEASSSTPAGKEGKEVLKENFIPSSVQGTSLHDTDDEWDVSRSGLESSNQPSSSSNRRKRRRESIEPGTEEYKKKRELNNISVRKSREKARQKQKETEGRVEILSAENSRLQDRVDSLEKELTILKGLFSNIGAAVPPDIDKFLSTE